jgi:hypothetical protein
MKFSLKGIIAISGKPGLYKVIAQGNQNVIVESLIDRKRTPAYSSSKISALDEITMYTTGEEDMPLPAIIQKIYEKENGGKCVDVKDEANHRSYFKEIVPDFDEEKVYSSDIRKLFGWYSLMLTSGELKRIAEEAAKAATEEPAKEKEAKTGKKAKAEAKPKAEEPAKEVKKEKTEKAPAKKPAAKTKVKAEAKPKAKGESKAKASAVRKAGGQRGS